MLRRTVSVRHMLRADSQADQPPGNAAQPVAVPALEAVDLDGQQLDLSPIADLGGALGSEWHHAGNAGLERGQPGAPDFSGGALGDHIRALPIIAAVELNEDPAGVETAHAQGRI